MIGLNANTVTKSKLHYTGREKKKKRLVDKIPDIHFYFSPNPSPPFLRINSYYNLKNLNSCKTLKMLQQAEVIMGWYSRHLSGSLRWFISTNSCLHLLLSLPGSSSPRLLFLRMQCSAVGYLPRENVWAEGYRQSLL